MLRKRKQNQFTDITQISWADKTYLFESLPDDLNDWVSLGHKIGIGALEVVLDHFGSMKPHVPTVTSFWGTLARYIRNEQMRNKFDGRNYIELASAYSGFMGLPKLAERQARTIIHEKQKPPRQRYTERCKPVKVPSAQHDRIAALARTYSAPYHDILEVMLQATFDCPSVQTALSHRFIDKDDRSPVCGGKNRLSLHPQIDIAKRQ